MECGRRDCDDRTTSTNHRAMPWLAIRWASKEAGTVRRSAFTPWPCTALPCPNGRAFVPPLSAVLSNYFPFTDSNKDTQHILFYCTYFMYVCAYYFGCEWQLYAFRNELNMYKFNTICKCCQAIEMPSRRCSCCCCQQNYFQILICLLQQYFQFFTEKQEKHRRKLLKTAGACKNGRDKIWFKAYILEHKPDDCVCL